MKFGPPWDGGCPRRVKWLMFIAIMPLFGPSMAAAAEELRAGRFEQQVLPLVRQNCLDCHNAEESEGGLDLSRFAKVEDLLAERKLWQRVVRQLKAGAMPPDGLPRPPEKEVQDVIAWLDEALVYVDPTQPPDPGRVTVRRLNRTEYNHTVRDLFGVSLNLADEFPADDLGYGFDNIGDVLSISPLRMEQYLKAAETLTSVLLLKSEQPVYDEFSEAVFFKYNQRPRNASDRGWELTPGTETFLEFELPAPGEYEIRIHAWAVEKPPEKDRDNNERWLEAEAKLVLDPDARPAVEATLLCDDQLIGHIPVLPGNGTTALKQVYTVRFTAQAGVHTIRARHRFPREMSEEDIAKHLEKPLLAPRLGLRRIGLRGPLRFGEARLAPAHRALLLTRPADDLDADAAARKALRTIADLAWRRPVTERELDQLVGFVARQQARGRSFQEALELAAQAVLVSPKFLFRLETLPADADPPLIAPVGDYALASRLSYFLWSSMPDEELFRLAAEGKLADPAVLTSQVDRMLKDRRSEAFVEGFFGQWLGLRRLPDVNFDPKPFPDFSSELKEDLSSETTRFVTSIVRHNKSILELLRAETTFVNGRLARFYGIAGVERDGDFREVSLAGTPRQGLLTQGGILMLSSYPNRTSPTRRGNWILETILGEEPPPPPDGVPELAETESSSPGLPLRQQLELHRTNAVCASCHRTMDAIGFGFENFNAIGQWRDTEGDQPIDAAGDLPSGETFESPRELIEILSRRQDDFARHLAGRLLTYALGRGTEYFDRPALDAIVDNTRADNFRFHDLVHQIVLSKPFGWQRHESEERQ
ncbi:MAG: DUF1592 domain-containing protein [Planctomycetaceae bacterium]|nr:MAG: DUF1592 domain-containing protein [Planctomycetaceae bacterium]